MALTKPPHADLQRDGGVVCEIDNGSNVSFLSSESDDDATNDSRDRHFCLKGPFAAGAVYVDSLQDKLAVQAYYNPDLLRIIHELVVGGAVGQEGRQRDVIASHLTFTRVPTKFYGKSYIQLFQYLIFKQMAIPLGLYRKRPWGVPQKNSNLPYVITNPNPDLLLNADDFIYTLDSKLAGEGTVEVKILHGRNFSFDSRPFLERCSCKVEINGLLQTTPPITIGASPEWEEKSIFVWSVPTNPWPLDVKLTLLGHHAPGGGAAAGSAMWGGDFPRASSGGNTNGDEDEVVLATHTLQLASETDLGKNCSQKRWLDFEEQSTYRLTTHQKGESHDSPVDRKQPPSLQVVISYFKPDDNQADSAIPLNSHPGSPVSPMSCSHDDSGKENTAGEQPLSSSSLSVPEYFSANGTLVQSGNLRQELRLTRKALPVTSWVEASGKYDADHSQEIHSQETWASSKKNFSPRHVQQTAAPVRSNEFESVYQELQYLQRSDAPKPSQHTVRVHRAGKLEQLAQSKEEKYEREYRELQHVVAEKLQEYVSVGRARRRMPKRSTGSSQSSSENFVLSQNSRERLREPPLRSDIYVSAGPADKDLVILAKPKSLYQM